MIKNIEYLFHGTFTQDGAGVKLKRIFGGHESAKLTDPFLLLDHFGSNKIEDYISGFPWHPHRGIETVTYLLEGKVEHEDSEGHKGTIYPSDIQWMTAGSGIFHQEMPKPLDDKDKKELLRTTGMPNSVVGMQLWLNMPTSKKMSAPTYRDFKGNMLPVIDNGNGATVKVVAGNYFGTEGLLEENPLKTSYFDILMEDESTFELSIENGLNSMAYIIAGNVTSESRTKETLVAGDLGVFSRNGDRFVLSTNGSKARVIFLAGKPLNEPIYWYGPIVMNSKEQIDEALLDLRNNTFVKVKEPNFL